MDPVPTPTAGRRPIRVLVVDARAAAPPALRARSRRPTTLVVVGEADDAEDGLRLCAPLAADVVLGDLTAGHDEVGSPAGSTAVHPPVQVSS